MDSSKVIVLITGANSGVGYAASTVITKASDKYHVIMASRNLDNGKKAAGEVQAMEGIKGSVSTVQLDQTDVSSIKRAAEEVGKEFGRLDVLVNNAGISVDETADVGAAMAQTFKTNSIGPRLVAEAFYDLLFKSSRPTSIYVSSGLGSMGLIQQSDNMGSVDYYAYRMSKAALDMWAVKEYSDHKDKGLKTFVMCPGLVESNLRGKSDDARSAGGNATSPLVSGETMLSIIDGRRNADVGLFVHKDGVYPW